VGKQLVDIEAVELHRTEGAIKIRTDRDLIVWLPLEPIEVVELKYDIVMFTVPIKLATQKGLV
jgi:hypothetical protein